MIVMSYFHPWTLRLGESNAEHVPHASNLRGASETWGDAMLPWFNGRVVSDTAKRYVGNLLTVHRVRPGKDDDENGADEDVAGDDELILEDAYLENVLKTRVGGRESSEAHAFAVQDGEAMIDRSCLLYTSPSPRDKRQSRMPSSA